MVIDMADISAAKPSSGTGIYIDAASPGARTGGAKTDDFIQFEPEKILEASQNLENLTNRFSQSKNNILSKVTSLNGIWQSSSATLFAEKMMELDKKSDELIIRLKKFYNDLARASGLYNRGEASAKQGAEKLPTYGVFLY